MQIVLLVGMLINIISKSYNKQLPYRFKYSGKSKLPIDEVLRPLQKTHMPVFSNFM